MRTFLILNVAVATCSLFPSSSQAQSKTVSFKKDVFPLLKARCLRCHQGRNAKSGVRLDARSELLGETTGKPLVKIGKSADSLLIQAVVKKRMPKTGKPLTAKEIKLLQDWIDKGLDWDEAQFAKTDDDTHWAFQPVKRPTVPKVANRKWVRNPIDAFVTRKHAEKKLTPAPEADRRILIRRLTLDLTGLLPTPEEVDAFVHDKSPKAYEKVVDRLLASPHYGERWARHWLDVARWAESEGYESNHLRPFAFRYRDYVVNSFNEDKSFRDFVREQIAGDEIEPYSDTNLIATGFLAAARLSSNEEDLWLQRNDILVDIVNATAGTFLGLTINCAQCHNHKFDPITARDYYRFQGFFLQGQPGNLELRDKKLRKDYLAKKPAIYDALTEEKWALYKMSRQRLFSNALKTLSTNQQEAIRIPSDKRTDEEERLVRQAYTKLNFGRGMIERNMPAKNRKRYNEIKKKIAAMEKLMPARPQTFGFYSPVTSPNKVRMLPSLGFYPLPYEPKKLALSQPHLLVGGDVHERGPKVDVGWPRVFGPVPTTVKSKPRLTLAHWLTSRQNPLTARVYVNRLWQGHFGRGIVATPGDFGARGAAPSHPQLLDWLAAEFMDNGWSSKHIHKLIVISNTYRQGSRVTKKYTEIDEDNAYLWHRKPRRLEAEAIRDIILCVSGKLDRRLGGKSETEETSLRRSLYLFQKRDFPKQAAALFDGPSASSECLHKRHVSTVPLQALFLLNNDFAGVQSRAFAKRVRKRVGPDRNKQVREVFRLALARVPNERELNLIHEYFDQVEGQREDETDSALNGLCLAVFNMSEFIYME